MKSSIPNKHDFFGIIILFILISFAFSCLSIIRNFEEKKSYENLLPYQNKSLTVKQRTRDLINRMTLDEKIGQMILVSRKSIQNPLDISRFNIGAVLNGAWDNPEPNTPSEWLNMVNRLQSYSQSNRLGIPLLYWVDTNHWHSNVRGATIFPHFIWLGAAWDIDLVKRVARSTAKEMSASNIHWWYSPDLDVVRDARWWRTYETFGSDAVIVWELGKAYVEWFQTAFKGGFKTMATAKHYIGNGSMAWGESSEYKLDKGNSNISENELREIHMTPFMKAIEVWVWSVMIGLNSWKWEKITGSKYLITDVLKKELWFTGIVITDWFWAYEINPNRYISLIKAINAWIDMVMLPYDYTTFTKDVKSGLKRGDIAKDRIDDAVSRIISKKLELWLFDSNPVQKRDLSIIGSKINRSIAREAVRKSLVLLKNDWNILPISKNAQKIFISGSSADNLWKQSWWWTVDWQGLKWNWIKWTTILSGIKSAVSKNTKVMFSERWEFRDSNADIWIAIVGEDPYAEGVGDKTELTLTKEDLSSIEKTRKASKNLIVIIVSGRPLDIRNFQDKWWVIIAAWLPWSEWQGVADVLFGDYPFIWRLPVKWDLK